MYTKPDPAQKSDRGFSWAIPHVLLLSVPALVAFMFLNGKLFGYHPTLMTLAYVALYGEGILLAAGAKGKDRDFFLWLHILFQVAGIFAILFGFLCILQNKFELGKPHFVSLHSRLGLGTLLMTAFAAPGGLPDFYGLPPSWRKFRTLVNRTHRRIGRVAFAASLLTIVTGLQTFTPAHPLHKGLLTYACAAGVAAAGVVVFARSGLNQSTRRNLFGKVWRASRERPS